LRESFLSTRGVEDQEQRTLGVSVVMPTLVRQGRPYANVTANDDGIVEFRFKEPVTRVDCYEHIVCRNCRICKTCRTGGLAWSV